MENTEKLWWARETSLYYWCPSVPAHLEVRFDAMLCWQKFWRGPRVPCGPRATSGSNENTWTERGGLITTNYDLLTRFFYVRHCLIGESRSDKIPFYWKTPQSGLSHKIFTFREMAYERQDCKTIATSTNLIAVYRYRITTKHLFRMSTSRIGTALLHQYLNSRRHRASVILLKDSSWRVVIGVLSDWWPFSRNSK